MKNHILKVFAVLLAFVMLFMLVSCGGKDKDKDSSGTTGTSSATEKGNQAPTVTAGAETNGESSGGKTEETTSTTEPEDKDNEGEFVISSEGIQLPIIELPNS